MIAKFNGNISLHQVPTFDNYKKTRKMLDITILATKKHSNVIPYKHNSLLMVKKPLFFGGTIGV